MIVYFEKLLVFMRFLGDFVVQWVTHFIVLNLVYAVKFFGS